VLVVDDSPVFVDALRDVLASRAEFKMLGDAATGEEGVAMAVRLQPDMVLVDVLLPGIDGLETCRRMCSRHPAPFVVLCSVEDDPRDLSPGLPCSAAPFLDKRSLTSAALVNLWHGPRVPE
jgi:DNA-binding NarL/FixJ family response regulator